MKEYYLHRKKIYYRQNEFISGRRTLVFVHGLSGSSSAWAPYEEKYSLNFNVLTYDLRGHGKSFKYPDYADYAIEKYTDDLNELILHLNLSDFILISHSYGTLIALDYVSRFKNRAVALVFLSVNYQVNRRLAAKIAKFLLSGARLCGLFPLKRKRGWHVDYSRFKMTGDWHPGRMWADIKNTTLRIYLWGSRQAYNFSEDAKWDNLTLPALFVHGRLDSIAPVENSILLSQKLKNARLVILPDANHIIVLNNFSEVTKAMDDFFRSIK